MLDLLGLLWVKKCRWFCLCANDADGSGLRQRRDRSRNACCAEVRHALAGVRRPRRLRFGGLMLLGKADAVLVERLRLQVSDTVVPILDVLSRPVDAFADRHRAGAAVDDPSPKRTHRLRGRARRLLHWQAIAQRLEAENASLRQLLKRRARPRQRPTGRRASSPIRRAPSPTASWSTPAAATASTRDRWCSTAEGLVGRVVAASPRGAPRPAAHRPELADPGVRRRRRACAPSSPATTPTGRSSSMSNPGGDDRAWRSRRHLRHRRRLPARSCRSASSPSVGRPADRRRARASTATGSSSSGSSTSASTASWISRPIAADDRAPQRPPAATSPSVRADAR